MLFLNIPPAAAPTFLSITNTRAHTNSHVPTHQTPASLHTQTQTHTQALCKCVSGGHSQMVRLQSSIPADASTSSVWIFPKTRCRVRARRIRVSPRELVQRGRRRCRGKPRSAPTWRSSTLSPGQRLPRSTLLSVNVRG